MNAKRDHLNNMREPHFGSAKALMAPLCVLIVLSGISSLAGAAITVAPTAPALKSAAVMNTADADMQAVLDAHAALGPKPIETLAPTEARKQPTPADAVMEVLKQQGRDTLPGALVPGISSIDRDIPSGTESLPVRIYTPEGNGPFPVIVYFHGGGWVLADKNVYDGGARGIARLANAIVMSVDYRLAPEHKFPAQHEDAFTAYKWVADNASSINGDPSRLALAGESAGGNLAIATAISARDLNVTMPLHILAVYPIAQATDLSTLSYLDSEMAKPLNKAMMQWFADNVFSTPNDRQDTRIDLVQADLKGLPPVTLINAHIDPLRSDGDMLALSLRKAGVAVEHKIYEGVTHEFFGMAAVVGQAQQAQEDAGAQLAKSLGTEIPQLILTTER